MRVDVLVTGLDAHQSRPDIHPPAVAVATTMGVKLTKNVRSDVSTRDDRYDTDPPLLDSWRVLLETRPPKLGFPYSRVVVSPDRVAQEAFGMVADTVDGWESPAWAAGIRPPRSWSDMDVKKAESEKTRWAERSYVFGDNGRSFWEGPEGGEDFTGFGRRVQDGVHGLLAPVVSTSNDRGAVGIWSVNSQRFAREGLPINMTEAYVSSLSYLLVVSPLVASAVVSVLLGYFPNPSQRVSPAFGTVISLRLTHAQGPEYVANVSSYDERVFQIVGLTEPI